MRRSAVGAPVEAHDLQVVAYDAHDETMNGNIGTVYVQEMMPAGNTDDPFLPCPLLDDRSARVCGISTFRTLYSPLAYRPRPGDLVDVSGGTYDEFTCSGVCGSPPQPFPNGLFLPQVRMPTIANSGVAPLSPPIHVTLADLAAHNAALIGALVEVDDVTAVAAPDARGEIALTTARSGPMITQEMTAIPGVVAGTRWAHVVGVVSYFYSPKLIPRSLGDLTPGR
ncbi:MAG: hypothetical protein EPO40_02580 [Myxococcaceae bacterium]|nr:MAG: hypothetical protein EPO40_02580 [Myxococcaceae bacterium]